jgi:hypothetical protein
MRFETSVFVNCPFDEEYRPLLRPILFAIIDLGMTPRIALESLNSGAPRIGKIVELVKASRYAIHDLSRMQASVADEYYRMNMPFELGLDVGCALFGGGPWSTKRCLILEKERYRFQAAISDMSNSDIASHGNDPFRALSEVRNWLNTEARLRALAPSAIWSRFEDFTAANYDRLEARGFTPSEIERLQISELTAEMADWVSQHPPPTRDQPSS